MIVLAVLLSALSGALAAVAICKAVKLKLYLELIAGFGAMAALKLADMFGGAMGWPLLFAFAGYLAVVLYMRAKA